MVEVDHKQSHKNAAQRGRRVGLLVTIILVLGLAGGVLSTLWHGGNGGSFSLEDEHQDIADAQELAGALEHLSDQLEQLRLSFALWKASNGSQGVDSARKSLERGLQTITIALPAAERTQLGTLTYLSGVRAALVSYQTLIAHTLSRAAPWSDSDLQVIGQAQESLGGWLHSLAEQQATLETHSVNLTHAHEQHENSLKGGLLLLAVGSGALLTVFVVLWQRQWWRAQQLGAESDTYQGVFQGSYAIELLIDAKSGAILDANKAAVAFYGWDRNTLQSMRIDEINCLTHEQIAAEMQLAKKEQRNHFFFQHRRADGTISDVEVNSTPLQIHGREALCSIIHDISHQRRIERELEASRKRYSDVINASVQGFWFVEPMTGVVMDVNQAMCTLLGYPREHILGRSFISFAHPDEQAALQERFSLAANTLHRVYEVRLKTQNGDDRHTRFFATSLWNKDGEIEGSYAFVDDITEQKKASARLQESQNRLAVVIEAGNIGVWEYRPDENSMWFSPEWKAQLGYQDHELPNTRDAWEQIILPEDGRMALQCLEALAAGSSETVVLTLRYRHRAGHLVYARCCMKALYRIDGRIERFLGAHLDLTPQFEVQETLALANARNALILDSATDGLMSVDSDGRISLINAACQRLLGVMAQGIVGRLAGDLLRLATQDGAPLLAVPAMCALEASDTEALPKTDETIVDYVLRTGRSLPSVSAMLCQPSGGLLSVEVGVAPLLWQNQISGAVISLHDVTEQGKHRQELERSNNELEQFAYMASHDLQEPLRTITSYLTLLRRRYSGALDQDGQEFMGMAVDGAQRMSTMIRDLLEYSRVGRRQGERSPVAVGDAAVAALGNVKMAVEDVGAEISIQPDMPVVMADRTLLVSLLQNLLGNALKYRAPDRAVQIAVHAEVIAGAVCRVSVVDNGIGIEEAYFERIFQPFQRLHTREHFEGNGIGLAICRKIARQHGGDLTVTSEPGKGSTFSFTLSLAEPFHDDAANAI